MNWNFGFIILAGYFLGAIPFAVLVAKCRGVNVLACGSCNPGATNVHRTAGKLAGRIVFLCDALKGLLAAQMAIYLAHDGRHLAAMSGLMGAFLGHNFSVFIKFRGGKGIAVLMGGMAAIMANVLFIGLLTWAVVFLITKYASLASICFSAVLPLCSYLFGYDDSTNMIVLSLGTFAVIRHVPNIRRLLAGTEYRFTSSKTHR
ncbi:MAG: glycerol-3-phosphate 1-O-acyltransferase PlsY [Puniceicoccales bacterium]|jgi:glycerol-3-phosphate acyltransferase PlsY|nr:glycerol-3-phosphate 1-O-acyltransferase PlsY [Puniceicoccales bacterium]